MPKSQHVKPPKHLTIVFLVAYLLIFLVIPSFAAEDYLVVETEGSKSGLSRLEYFRGNIPASDFYNYYKLRPNTGLEKSSTCLLIPYREPSNQTSLIIVMGGPGSSIGGAGKLKVRGLAEGAEAILRDDPPDQDPTDGYSVNPPTATFQWSWEPGLADGVIISDLTKNPDLEFKFDLLENVDEVRIITGDIKDPRVTSLDPVASIRLRGVERNPRLKPEFSVSELHRLGQNITFDASNSTAPEGRIIQYEWDFDGDGHFAYISHKSVVEHTFVKSGNHEIALRITDDRGNKAVKRKEIVTVESPLEAERKLSARKVRPGETINCVIKITARTEVAGIGIDDSVPDGWRVIPEAHDEGIFKPSTSQWVLPDKLEAGETRQINFRIRTPSQKEFDSGSPDRKGELSGKISSASPEFVGQIEGDSSITVSPELEPLEALSHLDVGEGKLDFGLPSRISDRQLKRVINSWQTGRSIPGIDEKEITFEFVKKALLYYQKGLDSNIRLSKVEQSKPEVLRRVKPNLPGKLLFVHSESPLANEGERIIEFGVEVIIKPRNRTLMGVGLKEKIPDGWEIVPTKSDNLAYKDSTDQWVITRPIFPGEEFSVPYNVRIPIEESSGCFTVSGVFSESWSGGAKAIKGESSLNLTRTLPIHLVISRWGSEAGELDLTTDNYISEPQARKAIQLWVLDEPVPYTEGEKLNFEEIIAYQLERKPVVES